MGLETADLPGNTSFKTPRPMPKAEDQATDKEINKEETRSAKDIIQFLVKTTRTLKIYHQNNPIHQKFISELKAKFDQHLTTYGPLRIQVRQHELVCSQEVLYEDSNRMESVAFKLYIDGIREITFHEGLEQGEIVGFLEALGKEGTQGPSDDDITTVLWEKGLSHITYQIADDSTQKMEIEAAPLPEGRLMKAFKEEAQGAKEGLSSSTSEMVQPAERKYQDLTYQNIFFLSPEEIAKVKHEMQVEEEQDLLAEMVQILTAILQVEENAKDFEEVVKIFQEMYDLMISRGDLNHSRRILEVFRELQSSEKQLPETHQQLLSAAMSWVGGGEQIEKLKNVLNSDLPLNLDHLYALLVLHPPIAVPSLIDLLGTLNKIKPRRILCDAMVELAREEIGILVSRLSDRRWFTVRNIVYILGKIGNEQAVNALVSVMNHPETRVRKEVLRAFEVLPGSKSKQYLMKFLKDEDSSMRILAAKNLAHAKVPGTTERLLEIINDVQFKDRDLYEKKEVFDSLGRVGGNGVLPLLQKILKQHTWFRLQKGRVEELKLCAIIALKRVRTPEALKVLREGCRSSSKNVRDACTRVLSELERDKG